MSLELDCRGDLLHIHTEECFVMYPENRGGLAKIIRALKPYKEQEAVGDPHELCITLEKLQDLRFQIL